jgi:hypothetical protein
MLEVSPVRAFPDNRIWLIRTPAHLAGVAGVDPWDARPAADMLDREGLRLRAISLTASRELRSGDEPTLPSTIGLERRINPFLRRREPTARADRCASSVEETFAVIRSWNFC